jgi:hypothetical protein
MPRVVVLGHGAFNTTSFEVLVPPETTITFLGDAGSTVSFPTKRVGSKVEADDEKVAAVLEGYLAREKPLVAKKVVPIMYTSPLSPAEVAKAKYLQIMGKWGAEVLVTDPAELCSVGPNCPEPVLLKVENAHKALFGDDIDPPDIDQPARDKVVEWVAGGGSGDFPVEAEKVKSKVIEIPADYRQMMLDGVPPDRWHHTCDGLLKNFAKHDIVWLACSFFAASEEELKELGLEGGPRVEDPLLGEIVYPNLPPEMIDTAAPSAGGGLKVGGTELDLEDLMAEEETTLALVIQKWNDTPLGGSIPLRVAPGPPGLFLLGSDYSGSVENYAKRAPGLERGTLTLKASPAFKNKLKSVEIRGISSAENRAQVRESLVEQIFDRLPAGPGKTLSLEIIFV